jgi:hypothetical protein
MFKFRICSFLKKSYLKIFDFENCLDVCSHLKKNEKMKRKRKELLPEHVQGLLGRSTKANG